MQDTASDLQILNFLPDACAVVAADGSTLFVNSELKSLLKDYKRSVSPGANFFNSLPFSSECVRRFSTLLMRQSSGVDAPSPDELSGLHPYEFLASDGNINRGCMNIRTVVAEQEMKYLICLRHGQNSAETSALMELNHLANQRYYNLIHSLLATGPEEAFDPNQKVQYLLAKLQNIVVSQGIVFLKYDKTASLVSMIKSNASMSPQPEKFDEVVERLPELCLEFDTTPSGEVCLTKMTLPETQTELCLVSRNANGQDLETLIFLTGSVDGASSLVADETSALIAGRAFYSWYDEIQSYLDFNSRSPSGYLSKLTFLERMEVEIAIAIRSGAPLSLVLVEIERTSEVQHTNYSTEREVRQRLASVLRTNCRSSDLTSELSPASFGILMLHTDVSQAVSFGENIRSTFSNLELHSFQPGLAARATLGVATMPVEGGHELLRRANIALDQAREFGGNMLQLYFQQTEGLNE